LTCFGTGPSAQNEWEGERNSEHGERTDSELACQMNWDQHEK
jgi:hypothetical protein